MANASNRRPFLPRIEEVENDLRESRRLSADMDQHSAVVGTIEAMKKLLKIVEAQGKEIESLREEAKEQGRAEAFRECAAAATEAILADAHSSAQRSADLKADIEAARNQVKEEG